MCAIYSRSVNNDTCYIEANHVGSLRLQRGIIEKPKSNRLMVTRVGEKQ